MRLALAMAALLSLAYAVWALTARRGIFAGFEDGGPAGVSDAVSSDHLDTALLTLAAAAAAVALVWWIVSVATRRSSRSGATVAAMALCLLGTAVALAGLILSAGVANGADVADQGGKGVTAALVMGGGFLLLTIGLGLGSLTASRPQPTSSSWPPQARGPAGW